MNGRISCRLSAEGEHIESAEFYQGAQMVLLAHAHGLLVLVYRDTSLPIEVRLDAAKVAINYEIPRLSAVDAKVGVEAGVTSSLNDEQRRERARRMIAEAFAERPPVVEGKFRVIAGRDVGDAEHDGEARPADDEPA